MDVDRYRKRYEAELAKAAAPPKSRSRSRRSAAAVAPVKSSAAARVEAIQIVAVEEQDLDDRVSELLATLLNRKESVAVRSAALQALGALDFLGPRFDPYRAAYKEALRALATDRSRTLRERAFERLALDKDRYAQGLLIRGLEHSEDALVSDARALQFLAYDDHAEFAPLARRVYKRSTGVAREEALRMLATDPQSERLFTRLLKDKSEKSSIRRISASGLQSLNPRAFEKTAGKIVADDSDYNEIRATSLAALAHGREARETEPDQALVDTAEKLTKQSRSTALRASSKRFLRATGA
jgi:hypothetical protein